jgi:hypothetical protein
VVAGEHRAMLNAGELLPKVLIPAPGKTNEGRFLFCTRNKVIEDRKGAAPLAALVDSLAVDGLQGAALAPALARHTGGNPQFVLETVKALLLTNAQNESLSIEGERYLQALINRQRAVASFLPTLDLAPSYFRGEKVSGTGRRKPTLSSICLTLSSKRPRSKSRDRPTRIWPPWFWVKPGLRTPSSER